MTVTGAADIAHNAPVRRLPSRSFPADNVTIE